MLGLDAFIAPTPDLRGQGAGDVFGQAERLADIAQRAAGAIADDGGAERRPVAAIGVVDPLDDFLAPLVLEIDIDVGRLFAFLRDEALEQQVVALGIDGGDAEHIADRGIGRRAAALAEDVPALRAKRTIELHRQEIRRVAELLDQPQFMAQDLDDLVRHTFGIALRGAFPGELLQRLLRRAARHRRLRSGY